MEVLPVIDLPMDLARSSGEIAACMDFSAYSRFASLYSALRLNQP